MNTTNLLNQLDNTGTLAEAQVVLAPLVATIDHTQSVQILGQSGDFDIVAVRRNERTWSRDISEDQNFFAELLALFGAENLARCLYSGACGTAFEVSGSAHGLTSLLRHWNGTVVDAGRDLRWVDPAAGKVFPLRGLAHLAEVVAEYAERRAVSV